MDASVFCHERGGELACVATQEEADYLGQKASNMARDLWISTTDAFVERQFMAPCATQAFAYPWCPGEPNNGGGGEGAANCVRIVGKSAPGNGNCEPGKWADFGCDQYRDNNNNMFGFVCEINDDKMPEWERERMNKAAPAGLTVDAIREAVDSNPAAIFFCVVFALAFFVSLAFNYKHCPSKSAGGKHVGINPVRGTETSSYSAPLTVPGGLSSSSGGVKQEGFSGRGASREEKEGERERGL